MVVAGAVAASGLVLAGCGVGNLVGPESEDKATYSVTDKVTALEVDSGSGEIVITESARSGISVTETLRWRGNDDNRPEAEHPVSGEKLTLTYKCPTRWSCDVDYRVEIPRGLNVDVDTGSGTITLRDLSGAVDASTGSGEIDAAGLTGKKVVGKTGSGDVELKFGGVPDDVTVETGSGNGSVWVPAGAYNVTTETGSGEEQVDVTKDSAAPRKIVVKTGSGDAKVLTGTGA